MLAAPSVSLLANGGGAFSDPENAVGDAIRLFVILAGVVVLGLFLTTARRVRNDRQYGMMALVCFGISAIGTEISQLGETVTYRLVVNTAGVVLGVIFLFRTYQHAEDHDEDHHSGDGSDR